jgi:hypothetical protein
VRRSAVGRLLGRIGEEEERIEGERWGRDVIGRRIKEKGCWMLGCSVVSA